MLRSPDATVDDALAVAIQIRERLADSIAVSGFGPATTYEELLFEKVTGDAALDPEPEGSRRAGRQASADGGARSRAEGRRGER